MQKASQLFDSVELEHAALVPHAALYKNSWIVCSDLETTARYNPQNKSLQVGKQIGHSSTPRITIWNNYLLAMSSTSSAFVPIILHSLHLGQQNAKWTSLRSKNQAPQGRSSSSMITRYPYSLIVFGGQNSNSCLNDIHSFDMVTCKWRAIVPVSVQLPKPRYDFAYAYANDELWILGGFEKVMCLNDLWFFHFTTLRWTCVDTNIANTLASNLTLHSRQMTFHGHDRFFVALHPKSLYEYHTTSNTWKQHELANSYSMCSASLISYQDKIFAISKARITCVTVGMPKARNNVHRMLHWKQQNRVQTDIIIHSLC